MLTFDHPAFQSTPWELAHGKSLVLGPAAVLMGVLNVTPDSFSDGGLFLKPEIAEKQALALVSAGASIIDIGGESTKPNAEPVSESIEQARVLPIIECLAELPDVLISIDTYRASTAKMAVEAGAHIINDVWGFQRDREIAKVAAETGAGCCLMHTGRERQRNRNVLEDQMEFLSKSLKIAKAAGVKTNSIVLDPGFGFAKDPDENIELLANFEQLHQLGCPLLVGTSRKRFVGHISGRDVEDRDVATSATSVVARLKGGAIFRVHAVKPNRDGLAVADAILSAKQYG